MKKIIKEQGLDARVAQGGKLSINGQMYKLLVKKGILGWIDVAIKNLTRNPNGWTITASAYGTTATEQVPTDTIAQIQSKVGADEIFLGGKTPKKLVKENTLKSIIKKALKEQEETNYMFFSNLEQIKRQCEMLLNLDTNIVDKIIQNGHDWADDHITEAKTNMDQVFDFMMNETKKQSSYVEYEDITEGKKKAGTKLCSRGKSAAKAKFKVYPSAYANGYAVQVCKGKMPGTDGKKRCSPPYC